MQDCLILVTNCFSTITSYENQTKKAITNKFIQEAMTEFFREQLEIYFIEHKTDADRVMEQVLINKRSRETAEKARLNIKKKLTGNVDLANRVQKFVDCRSKDVSRREIYIVEGDSALGACKLSRDAEFQGIMPVRGKILNCLKADYDAHFQERRSSPTSCACSAAAWRCRASRPRTSRRSSLENLRWNKIIICTDADVDGFQIRTLILTMLYRLAPTLIREGYVYIAESPLYEIVSKDKTYFAYSDREKAAIVDGLGGAKADINRSKGLGENDPEMMWLTTMNPDTRQLIQRHAGGCRAHGADVRSAARRQSGRAQGAHRRDAAASFSIWPIFPEKNLRKGTVTLCREKKHRKSRKQSIPTSSGCKAEVISQPITETLEQNYMPYAMSVIVSRAIPEIDGFKPSPPQAAVHDV